ncbi:hypothetical protein B0H13DRAFT_3945, partial [Mycena leptocephala]
QLAALRAVSPLPVFLLSLAGPILCISGLIFVDNRVVSQRLMDYQSCIPLLTHDPRASRRFRPNEIQVALLAQKLRALGRCLDQLDDYYGHLQPQPLSPLSPAPHFCAFNGLDRLSYKLSYTSCLAVTPLAQQRALFRANATNEAGETVACVVKFTASYGEEAHVHMFEHGAAPRLLYCNREESVGRLFVVVMEYTGAGTKAQFGIRLPLTRLGMCGLRELNEGRRLRRSTIFLCLNSWVTSSPKRGSRTRRRRWDRHCALTGSRVE